MSAYSLFQLAPGATLLDRYEIQETNRRGSMSAAFRATDNTDGSACELQAFPSGLFENVEIFGCIPIASRGVIKMLVEIDGYKTIRNNIIVDQCWNKGQNYTGTEKYCCTTIVEKHQK